MATKAQEHQLIFVRPGFAYVLLRASTMTNVAVFPRYLDAFKYRILRPFSDLKIRLIYFPGAWVSANEACDESSEEFMDRVKAAGEVKEPEGFAVVGRALIDLLRDFGKPGQPVGLEIRTKKVTDEDLQEPSSPA